MKKCCIAEFSKNINKKNTDKIYLITQHKTVSLLITFSALIWWTLLYLFERIMMDMSLLIWAHDIVLPITAVILPGSLLSPLLVNATLAFLTICGLVSPKGRCPLRSGSSTLSIVFLVVCGLKNGVGMHEPHKSIDVNRSFYHMYKPLELFRLNNVRH